jgi:hypothetical protein
MGFDGETMGLPPAYADPTFCMTGFDGQDAMNGMAPMMFDPNAVSYMSYCYGMPMDGSAGAQSFDGIGTNQVIDGNQVAVGDGGEGVPGAGTAGQFNGTLPAMGEDQQNTYANAALMPDHLTQGSIPDYLLPENVGPCMPNGMELGVDGAAPWHHQSADNGAAGVALAPDSVTGDWNGDGGSEWNDSRWENNAHTDGWRDANENWEQNADGGWECTSEGNAAAADSSSHWADSNDVGRSLSEDAVGDWCGSSHNEAAGSSSPQEGAGRASRGKGRGARKQLEREAAAAAVANPSSEASPVESMATPEAINTNSAAAASAVQPVENGPVNYTTVMLRNIPNKYTQDMLVKQLCQDFRGEFDFVYLPIDFKNRCNVGYGFINFRTVEACDKFVTSFNGVDVRKCLPGLNSRKVAEVTPARVQGLEENVRRLRNSPVMNELVLHPEWMPLLLSEGGEEQAFPMPDQPCPPVKPRRRTREERP